ncbi:hypothetical protein EDD86DRAFT_206747 [Gorgonomyces haynaldii]|nr:hypothetical protein EDD86DRAFT_213700 [Gorgonomyces haynaldii]KAI8909026.1 hypothetical protein EDD86DRAFT_206747 [Gorgonomyces haynaldii]
MPDFPRGGQTGLTPLEYREVHDKVKQDLFREPEASVQPQKRQRIQEVKSLTYKMLSVGMTFAGVVSQVNELDLTVSLPNQLQGFVSITEVSNAISEEVERIAEDEDEESELPSLKTLFAIGDPVVCAIVSLGEDKKRIDLSLKPQHVNKQIERTDVVKGMTLQGVVQSEEDHGYIIDLGSFTGFLPHGQTQEKLKVSKPILVSVAKAEGQAVQLTTKNNSTLPGNTSLELDQLKAGMMVSAKVGEQVDAGIKTKILGYFDAGATYVHLNMENPADQEAIETAYPSDKKLKFRILYVDYENKYVALSLLPHFVEWTAVAFPESVHVGAKLEAKILRVDQQVGLFVRALETRGFVHISRISDERLEKIGKPYKVGSQHLGRVLSLDYCDQIAVMSFQQKILQQQYMSMHDVQVGAIVKGTIVKLEAFGVFVSLSETITGLCPSQHMADVKLSHPERHFKVGSQSTFRVLAVDPSSNRVTLSHKKSFINSALEPITSYNVPTGTVGLGMVVGVKDYGCVVQFFNQVKCLVPKSELSYEFVKDPKTLYSVGQSIKCRVISTDPENEKMKGSFKTSHMVDLSGLELGQMHECTFLSTNSEGVFVKLQTLNGSAFIPTPHLSDSLVVAQKMFKLLQTRKGEQQSLGKVMVYNIEDGGRVVVTKKQMLMDYVQEKGFVKTLDQLETDEMVCGVVRNITDKACYIEVCGLVGMASIHAVADQFIAQVSDFVQIGQNVLANVVKIDEDASRITFTLKPSQLDGKTVLEHEIKFLESYFLSLDAAASLQGSLKLKPGSSVSGHTGDTFGHGISVNIPNAKAVLHTQETISRGTNVQCQVLDFDPFLKIADLKKDPKTVVDGKEISQAFSTRQELDAVVELVKEEIAVLSLPKFGHALSFALNHHYNHPRQPRFKSGQTVKVHVVHAGETAFVQLAKEKSSGFVGKRLIKPVDSRVQVLEDVVPGMMIKAKIDAVKEMQINLSLADNLKGRVHVTELFDAMPKSKKPFEKLKPGAIVEAKVLGFHDMKTHNYLPFSHRTSGVSTVVDMTLKPSELKGQTSIRINSTSDLKPGMEAIGYVQKIDKSALWVQLSPTVLGRVDVTDCTLDPEIAKQLDAHFIVGQPVVCYITRLQDSKLDMSLLGPETKDYETLQVGTKLLVSVAHVDPAKGLSVSLGPKRYGRVHLTDIQDGYPANVTTVFNVGDYALGVVAGVDASKKRIDISLKQSEVKDGIVEEELKEGQVVKGYVRAISEKGCFVDLSRTLHGRVKIANLSDAFIKDWSTAYKPGQLVTGRILSIDAVQQKVELSLKQSDTDPDALKIHFADLKEGSRVSGVVTKVEKYGVFIRVQDSQLSGLCHISEVSDQPVQNLERLYAVGDLVRAYVLKVDQKKRQIGFSLKSSYFEDSDEEMEQEEPTEMEQDEDSEQQDEEMQIAEEETEVKPAMHHSAREGIVKPLQLPAFSWEADISTFGQVQSDDEEEEETSTKKTKRQKKKEKQDLDDKIAEEEMAQLEDREPEMPQDFERLLLGSPNNSYLWIKYIAFQLGLAEIEKARQVAERALKIINFREEQEKMNIWVAYLNLENSFGTPDTLEKLFDRALQMNDPKKIYIHMAQIYERTNKLDLAETTFTKMSKKFNQSAKVWVGFAMFYFRVGRPEDARRLFSRSLQSLPNRKHVKVLTKFAQLEFKHGEAERARTLFENLLNTYPKRTDLWSIYCDMEIKNGDLDITRRLFERILQMKWNTKKMKFFFKKYLDFEKKSGTPEGVAHVKDAAARYVATLQ